MASRFDKNFTERGYTMSYLTMPDTVYYKSHVLQFLIEIKGIKPRIWRRIQVPSNYNFWDLHVAIQDALGWWDSHLHHFEIKGKGKRKVERIGIPDFSGSGDLPEVFPECTFKLNNQPFIRINDQKSLITALRIPLS